MWAFASKSVPIELVPCSDGWRRTWWQTIHMMPGLPVFSIPQCKQNCHKGTCLASFQAIGRFELTFIEALRASKVICKVRSLKSRIKTRSSLEEMTTSSNELLKDFESDMAVGIRNLGNLTPNTAESEDTESRKGVRKYWLYSYKQKNLICETLHACLWSCIQGQIAKTDRVKLDLGTAQCCSLLCWVLSLHKYCWRSVGTQW